MARLLSLTSCTRIFFLVALFAFFQTPSIAQQSENRFNKPGYGDIALRVVNMLEDEHYLREAFSDEMSSRVLDTYIEMLDYSRIYFTQADIDRFDAEFRFNIDDQVRNEIIPAAYEIYSVYEKRVRSRVKLAKSLLTENDFTFDSDRVVHASRKKAKWAANAAEHDQLWHNLIENDLLREFIGDEAEKRAEEKAKLSGKPKKKEPEEKDEDSHKKIEKRYDRILKAVTENETEDVATFFMKAIARTYDPHSEYFSQPQYDNFQISMNKSLIGIGAMLQRDEENGGATIEGLVVGGPAFKNGGLKVKDRIIGVGQNDEKIKDVVADDLSDIVDLIRGEKGTTVKLKVSPVDSPDETKIISIVREKVDLKDSLASANLIITKDPSGREQRIGWIKLLSFYSDMGGGDVSATSDVRRLIDRLEVEGIDGLVFDLTNDGGGSLEEAINLTGLFIRKGPVVQARDWRGQRTQKSSRSPDPVYDGPLVVLTNRASASASEIFAAALQDYNRAVIVGDKSTFGKGTVQQLRPVMSGRIALPLFSRAKNQKGALKLTIQTFFRIDGTSTQLDGVVPDIHLPSTLDVADIGEASMRGPLKVEPIQKAAYAPFFKQPLPVDILLSASASRLSSDQAFKYVLEDIATEEKRLADNVVSLNKTKRLADYDKRDQKREARKAERIERFAATRESEIDLFEIYTFTQDNVGEKGKTLKADLSQEELSGMSRGKKEEEEEDPDIKALEYPHLLNPYQRETVRILQDLIAITETGKPVNISKTAPNPSGTALQPN